MKETSHPDLIKRELIKYKVKLSFVYSDIVHVEAEDEKEAIKKAIEECEEEYEYFYDSETEQED